MLRNWWFMIFFLYNSRVLFSKKTPPQFAKIIAGKNATPSEVTYIASLRYQNQHICGANIINPYFLLTAAHCMELPHRQYYTIKAGTHNLNETGSVRKLKYIIIYPWYSPQDTNYDIAILRLLHPLKFSMNITAVKLPPLGSSIPYNSIGTISGWGTTDPDKTNVTTNSLQIADVQIISRKECISKYPFGNFVAQTTICATNTTKNGTDACQGDSGGPLVANDILYGITSYGLFCGQYPGIYTNVLQFRSWICYYVGF